MLAIQNKNVFYDQQAKILRQTSYLRNCIYCAGLPGSDAIYSFAEVKERVERNTDIIVVVVRTRMAFPF